MTLSGYLGLGVLGSTCFLFGFFTGEWTAYDGRTVRQMLTYNHAAYEKIAESQLAIEVVSGYSDLGLAMDDPSQLEYAFSAEEDRVKEITRVLRRDLKNEDNYAVRVVMKTALETADKALDLYSRNNGINSTPFSGTN